jgi:hypothetical protein
MDVRPVKDVRRHTFVHTGTGAIAETVTLSAVESVKILRVHMEFSDVLTQDLLYYRVLDVNDNIVEEYAHDPTVAPTATKFTWKPPASTVVVQPTDKFVVAFANTDARSLVLPESNIQYEF